MNCWIVKNNLLCYCFSVWDSLWQSSGCLSWPSENSLRSLLVQRRSETFVCLFWWHCQVTFCLSYLKRKAGEWTTAFCHCWWMSCCFLQRLSGEQVLLVVERLTMSLRQQWHSVFGAKWWHTDSKELFKEHSSNAQKSVCIIQLLLLSSRREWNVERLLATAQKVLPHPSFVYCAQYHPTAQNLVVSGGYDSVIRVWRLDVDDVNGQLLQEFEGHSSFINTICFDSEGRNYIHYLCLYHPWFNKLWCTVYEMWGLTSFVTWWKSAELISHWSLCSSWCN